MADSRDRRDKGGSESTKPETVRRKPEDWNNYRTESTLGQLLQDLTAHGLSPGKAKERVGREFSVLSRKDESQISRSTARSQPPSRVESVASAEELQLQPQYASLLFDTEDGHVKRVLQWQKDVAISLSGSSDPSGGASEVSKVSKASSRVFTTQKSTPPKLHEGDEVVDHKPFEWNHYRAESTRGQLLRDLMADGWQEEDARRQVEKDFTARGRPRRRPDGEYSHAYDNGSKYNDGKRNDSTESAATILQIEEDERASHRSSSPSNCHRPRADSHFGAQPQRRSSYVPSYRCPSSPRKPRSASPENQRRRHRSPALESHHFSFQDERNDDSFIREQRENWQDWIREQTEKKEELERRGLALGFHPVEFKDHLDRKFAFLNEDETDLRTWSRPVDKVWEAYVPLWMGQPGVSANLRRYGGIPGIPGVQPWGLDPENAEREARRRLACLERARSSL